ncbi:MAG: FAD-dependent oxidoreductase, partial [Desulfamplus sp.]|nr:FAD-dependent oxidoreductase [Desulfamplus sp.]
MKSETCARITDKTVNSMSESGNEEENRSNMVDISINRDVLVVGAGSAGLESAAQIAAQGYKVCVIGEKTACARESGCTADMLETGKVNIMQDVSIESLAGVVGDFRAVLSKGAEKIESAFGAVVVAPQYTYAPLNQKYGLDLNDKVMSQNQFDALAADIPAGSTVAFLLGFAQEGDPVATGKVLNSALAVQQMANCSAYIYAGNVKVGAKGLERIFTQCRHAGVVCFKPSRMPAIEQSGDTVKIVIKDPVVRTDVELTPDYIVVEEALVVGQKNLELAATLRIDTDLDGLLPSNNVHRFPAKSNRDGVFVVNNSVDAANAALKVKGLIGDGRKTVAADRAKVDEDRCVICLTCY